MTENERRISPKLTFDAFDDLADEEPELARDLLLRLIDATRELNRQARRDFVRLYVLACGFELLNRNLLSEASAFGVKVAKLGFLRYAVPLAVSFVTLRLFTRVRDRNLLRESIKAICHKTYPDLYQSDLLGLVAPPAFATSDVEPPVRLITRRSEHYRRGLVRFEIIGVFLAIPTFLTYAIVQLFRQADPPFLGPAAVTLITAILLVATVLSIISSEDELEGRVF